jgi:hypothetical protein
VQLVVWDRRHFLLSFDNAHGPLRRAGIEVVFELTDAQRRQVNRQGFVRTAARRG